MPRLAEPFGGLFTVAPTWNCDRCWVVEPGPVAEPVVDAPSGPTEAPAVALLVPWDTDVAESAAWRESVVGPQRVSDGWKEDKRHVEGKSRSGAEGSGAAGTGGSALHAD